MQPTNDSSGGTGPTRPPLPISWPERQILRYGSYPAQFHHLLDGGWEAVQREAEIVRGRIAAGELAWPPALPGGTGGEDEWVRCLPPDSFDPVFPRAFEEMPSVRAHLDLMSSLQAAAMRGGGVWEDLQANRSLELVVMYLLLRWRHTGQQVYVLNPSTTDLLMETDLPDVPGGEVEFPRSTFFLKLPEGLFSYAVADTIFHLEGVLVSVTRPEPSKHRQITMLAAGRGERVEDPSAYLTFALDHRPINQLIVAAERTGLDDAGVVVGEKVPTAVFNFAMYVLTDHPDLEPVPPRPGSRKQGRKARRRDGKRSRLGYIYVGRGARAGRPAPVGGQGGKLERRVRVRGHWRMQAHGPGHSLRKPIWIKPHYKGADASEIGISAARVQPARRRDTSDS